MLVTGPCNQTTSSRDHFQRAQTKTSVTRNVTSTIPCSFARFCRSAIHIKFSNLKIIVIYSAVRDSGRHKQIYTQIYIHISKPRVNQYPKPKQIRTEPKMSDNEEKVLDSEQWKKEATAIINDVKCHVQEMFISSKLESDSSCIYLNLKTLEGSTFCIQVSPSGFSVVSNNYDRVDTQENEKFETPYSLLDSLSLSYRNSFGNKLSKALNELVNRNDDK